jgi:tRNA uridine 5-carbamoylmethylation protein Kti12
MKFIIITGPPATGKMTVGQELAKLTDLKLFFNHQSLDLVNQYFDFGTKPFRRLDDTIRFALFNEVAKSDLKGLIFTVVLAFDLQEDIDYLYKVANIFKAQNAQIGLVELHTDLEERLKRNKTENRLKHKPTKRDLAFSEKNLLRFDGKYRMYSNEDELPDLDVLKINNTNLTAIEVAELIVQHFEL